MDYEKKDFRKLYEDLVKSDWFKRAYHNKSLGECPFDIPELVESEDEKMRKEIIEVLQFVPSSMWEQAKTDYERCFAYLEKQKYDRMQPVYDNQESFESALDKAWKSYNDSGARTVDGCEDNYTECAYAKGFREGYLFGLQKQKDLDKMIVVSPEVWDKAISDAYENGEKDGKKQKEHQFCPDAPKEKSVGGYFLSSSHKDKNLDELSQEYVDGVKQYNQEPTWDLVQTAVCYGANWQKEQFEKNRLANCDALSKEECDRETDFAMEIIEKEHRQPTFNDAINYGMRLQKEQKPAEHSAKGRRGRMGGIPECVRRKAEAFRNIMEPPYDADDICTAYEAGALESAKPAEWSEEDEKKIIFLERLIRYNVPEGQYGWTDGHKGGFVTKLEAISMLKSLRPSWKPSEEQN